jgi:5-methylcytosine-specific restriction endonuclease McrA
LKAYYRQVIKSLLAIVSLQAEIRRQVWRRDNSECSNCKSTYALVVDHIITQASGGPSTFENLRLLCRSCNQRATIKYFGQNKMEQYLRAEVS